MDALSLMAFNLRKTGTFCVGWNLISAFAMPVGSKNRIGELHIRVNEAVLLLLSLLDLPVLCGHQADAADVCTRRREGEVPLR